MNPLDQDATLTQIAALHSTAITYLNKAAVLLAEYQDAIAPTLAHGGTPRIAGSSIRSLQLWIDWLTENQPALRQTIWDATGHNLTKRAYDQTREWKAPMTFWDDNTMASDAVLRIQTANSGKGRPPMIYFLWSQRYEVRSLFGVGPERPIPDQANGDRIIDESVKSLLGVVPPPESAYPIDPIHGDEVPFSFDGDPSNAETVIEPPPFDHVAWAERLIADRDGETPDV